MSRPKAGGFEGVEPEGSRGHDSRPVDGALPQESGGKYPTAHLCSLRRSATFVAMRSEYREEPCRSALNRVTGMGFEWSLNPYMGCAHRCTFCYVRAFERRADRPADDRYGASIRVKINVAEVLRCELSRRGWTRPSVAIGAATDPYQPAEG